MHPNYGTCCHDTRSTTESIELDIASKLKLYRRGNSAFEHVREDEMTSDRAYHQFTIGHTISISI